MKIEIVNFSEIPDKGYYVAKFNETFRRSATVCEYAKWYENPAWNKPTQAVLVKTEDGIIVSAAILFYQKLFIGDRAEDVAIMCGAWTLPQFRGCGHMRKMISAAIRHLPGVNVRYMCGFGLMDNASSRFEKGAGADLMPVLYVNGVPNSGAPVLSVNDAPEISLDEIYTNFDGAFSYTKEQFRLVYGSKILQVENGDLAIVHEAETSLNINFLAPGSDEKYIADICAIAKWAKEKLSKQLFIFESSQEKRQLFEACGFQIKDGYFSMLPVSEEFRKNPRKKIYAGDRQ